MQSWIKHPVSLKGQLVELIPLEISHFEDLVALASTKNIWEFLPNDCSNKEVFFKVYKEALLEREKGNHYPFVIRSLDTGKLMGSTRLFDIHPSHRKLEIGWTWLHPDYWGTAINFDCKLLLLTYCFETLKTIRVQLKTSDTNFRSRKAIEKIGGQFEGILRKDRIRDNGSIRNSAYYSILDEEWEKVKQELQLNLIERLKKQ